MFFWVFFIISNGFDFDLARFFPVWLCFFRFQAPETENKPVGFFNYSNRFNQFFFTIQFFQFFFSSFLNLINFLVFFTLIRYFIAMFHVRILYCTDHRHSSTIIRTANQEESLFFFWKRLANLLNQHCHVIFNMVQSRHFFKDAKSYIFQLLFIIAVESLFHYF